MSASRNVDAVSNQQGEFGSRVPRDEPQTTHGHKPGILVGNDTKPEFSAETLPAGTAPADRTFKPNIRSEVPSEANNPDVLRSHGKEFTHTAASDTLGGATSADVHSGLGHPGSGQTSSEIRHEGQSTGKKNPGGHGGGLAGVGASAPSGNQMSDS